MRAIVRFMAVAAVVFALAPTTAEAQRWTWDLGVHGGYSMFTNMSDRDQSGTDHISFDADPFAAAHLGFSIMGVGLRANAAYSERSLRVAPTDDIDKYTVMEPINVWSGSIDAMFRLGAVRENWTGTEVLPFLALGLGGRWVNPPGDDDTSVCNDAEEGKQWACAAFGTTTSAATSQLLAIGEQKGLLGHLGLGVDWRFSPSIALRLEAFDKISRPQIYRAGAMTGTSPRVYALPNGDEQVSKWTHELGLQAGLAFLMGLRPVAPVVVVTPPAPPPPPPPPPTPTPPAPREEAVTVCVIDPSATGGIRMQAATYRIQQRDTVVVVGGTPRPLRESVGNVMVARDAGWLVRGEPLNMTVNRETVRFLPYQGATRIEANRVVYLGNINGYPVYANRDEVADVITTINTARGTRTDAELGTLLADRRARDVVQGVQYLYVPVDPYGCVFQPIAPQMEVRKGGK